MLPFLFGYQLVASLTAKQRFPGGLFSKKFILWKFVENVWKFVEATDFQ